MITKNKSHTAKEITSIINSRGAALIEFALVLPLLLIIIFGIIEFSTIFYNKAMITNASREGARIGIVQIPESSGICHPSYDEIKAAVDDYCKNYLITFAASSTEPTTEAPEAGLCNDEPLEVTVHYEYNFLILPNFITGITGPLTLEAKTVMRKEQ